VYRQETVSPTKSGASELEVEKADASEGLRWMILDVSRNGAFIPNSASNKESYGTKARFDIRGSLALGVLP
jgi:hypothetical protein